MNYQPQPIDTQGIDLPSELAPLTERLAENAHDLWASQRLGQGWRWGITKEQQAEGKVLPICLEEIHTCRPYFIGILGERYGWIPNSVPPEVLAKEPWIQEHIGQQNLNPQVDSQIEEVLAAWRSASC